MPASLAPGLWTDGRAPLLRIVSPDCFDVRAYAGEGDWWRLAEGSTGRFVPDDATAGSWRVRIAAIGSSATRTLDQPALAAANGGPIETGAARCDPPRQGGNAGAPRRGAGFGEALLQPIVGTVTVPATGVSMMAGIARAIGRVVVRESALN